MSNVHVQRGIGRDNCNNGDPISHTSLYDLYANAVTHAERALEVIEELITVVQDGGDCESYSAALRSCCDQIAQADARIQAAQQSASPDNHDAGQRVLTEAERHLKVLSRLCDRIRHAEQVATTRLQTLSPGLDASIRGKQMVSAYRQRRV